MSLVRYQPWGVMRSLHNEDGGRSRAVRRHDLHPLAEPSPGIGLQEMHYSPIRRRD